MTTTTTTMPALTPSTPSTPTPTPTPPPSIPFPTSTPAPRPKLPMTPYPPNFSRPKPPFAQPDRPTSIARPLSTLTPRSSIIPLPAPKPEELMTPKEKRKSRLRPLVLSPESKMTRWKIPIPWHLVTQTRVLMTLYTICSLTTLGFGLLLTILSLKWIYPYNAPSPMMMASSSTLQLEFTTSTSYYPFILSTLDIFTGLGIGVLLLASFFASLPPAFGARRSIGNLMILNFGIAFDILGVIAGGTILWYRDLRPRENLAVVWSESTVAIQSTIQTEFQCCGWWDPTDLSEVVQSSTCPSTTLPGCVDPFGNYADAHLNHIFTFVYGVVALLSVWFLVNGCIVSERRLERRFRLIDEKVREAGYV